MGGDCAALVNPGESISTNPANLGAPVGGAGFSLAAVCDRCGWDHRSDTCRSLVFSVPSTYEDTAYARCLDQSLAFVSCVQRERCVCSGEIPFACAEIKSDLDACMEASRR